jgi:hypothetical protein
VSGTSTRRSDDGPPRRARGQAGVLAGGDGLLFATLILLAGSLAIVHVWSIIDTRAALDAAAREYLRSYTEQSDAVAADAAGAAAARELLDRRGTPLVGLRIQAPPAGTFGPCQPALVALEADVPATRLPFLDDLGTRRIRVTHRELVDPHREVTSGPSHDPNTTPCSTD